MEKINDCGHSTRYIVNANEGTQYCLMCEYEAAKETIQDYKDEYRKILSASCNENEKHCACVPALILRLQTALKLLREATPLVPLSLKIEIMNYIGEENRT